MMGRDSLVPKLLSSFSCVLKRREEPAEGRMGGARREMYKCLNYYCRVQCDTIKFCSDFGTLLYLVITAFSNDTAVPYHYRVG